MLLIAPAASAQSSGPATATYLYSSTLLLNPTSVQPNFPKGSPATFDLFELSAEELASLDWSLPAYHTADLTHVDLYDLPLLEVLKVAHLPAVAEPSKK